MSWQEEVEQVEEGGRRRRRRRRPSVGAGHTEAPGWLQQHFQPVQYQDIKTAGGGRGGGRGAATILTRRLCRASMCLKGMDVACFNFSSASILTGEKKRARESFKAPELEQSETSHSGCVTLAAALAWMSTV